MISVLQGDPEYQTGTLLGTVVSSVATLQGTIMMPSTGGPLQSKTITPNAVVQAINCDAGYYGLSCVTVEAIPSNYGRIDYNGFNIRVV